MIFLRQFLHVILFQLDPPHPMSAILPSSRPRASREIVIGAALDAWRKAGRSGALPEFFIFGVRGYYRDTMGKVGANERGFYDDAIFVVSPECCAAFNANTDPSKWRRGIATLCEGVHPYKPGNHGISRPGGGYPAFRPATKDEELPVQRDGIGDPWPGVAINIHKGGYSGTSSEGCQTIYPDQWDAFHALALSEFNRSKGKDEKSFFYILTSGPIV